ncbi:MAG: hypothetical protein AUJ92_16890 [Armatimonadetes bacterium CG2_30_59_28]|nr:hypothetical protein [Armatimonadota bacterium]OIO91294.1 MAG: hypothetical protein AUJ92_16890 [Armatimonadetes bacterium CG2_30_59_28]PIU65872.1 MAG: hypothetical protein COS85_07100 [Armatimonadetes bacterium CG07_land_8_20_14_0_80_59_28]PIY47202.1 MAG: hypothetical protein COZ05_05115 [Armatimonadetes bacterium CG_4_10_14_3_um_filter_59_10]
MEIGKKQAAVIIVVFAVVIAVVSTILVRRQLSPAQGTSLGTQASTSGDTVSPPVETDTQRHYDAYRVIGTRNIFNPPFSEKDAANPSGKLLPPAPAAITPPMPGVPRLPNPGHRIPMGMGPPSLRTLNASPIAATGIVRMDGKPYVLLEHLADKESATVGIGDAAFGYTLVSIVGENVTLRGPQGNVSLELGQNKKAGSPSNLEEKKPDVTPSPDGAPSDQKPTPQPEVTIDTSSSPGASFRTRRFEMRNSQGGRNR